MLFLLILAAFFYIAGYRLDKVYEDVTTPKYLRTAIRPPRFIFLICASPKLKEYPPGVMISGGVGGQLLGIGCAIYALVFFVNPEWMGPIGDIQIAIQVVSMASITAAALLIPYWLSKKYSYNE